jgi:uncharacterized protein YqgC (DUF456 family)
MSGEEKNEQSQKPKWFWLVILSLVLILFSVVLFFTTNTESPKHLILEYGAFYVALTALVVAFVLSLTGYYWIQKTKGSKSGQLCTASCAILAVFVLAGIFLTPQASVCPTSKRWWIGKIMAGSVATAIRYYAEENGPNANPPEDNDFEVLGIKADDLDGRYFNQSKHKMFSFTIHSMNPLKYTITVTNKYLEPNMMTLDQDGVWTETTE